MPCKDHEEKWFCCNYKVHFIPHNIVPPAPEKPFHMCPYCMYEWDINKEDCNGSHEEPCHEDQ